MNVSSRVQINCSTPLFAQDLSRKVVILDLRGGKTAATELLLQSLEAEARMRALRNKAGDPDFRLREREEDLKDWVSAEPLVTGQLEPPVADRLSDRRVGAQI
jgi:hypothetical protein